MAIKLGVKCNAQILSNTLVEISLLKHFTGFVRLFFADCPPHFHNI